MARARISEARLGEQLRCLQDERGALLREIARLQEEVCRARRAVNRTTCDTEHSSDSKAAGMKQEIAQLRQKVTHFVMATASAHNTQLLQERQLVAAQEQLRRQEESFIILKDEYLRLRSQTEPLQSARKGCGQLMARNSRGPTLVPADHLAELAASDLTTLQQQSQLLREFQDELRLQKFELCLARSQTRVADKQLQSQLNTRSSKKQQHQQTVGDRCASEAMEAEVSRLQSENMELKTTNHSLQQQVQTNSCTVATVEQAVPERNVLLEKKVTALESKLAEYQKVFAYQQEALDFHIPFPAFMPFNPQPLTIHEDNSKWESCCAKCSGPLQHDTIEMEFDRNGAPGAAAGLRQELAYSKEQLSECNRQLRAACDELAQKEAKLMSVSSTMTHLEREKSELEEESRGAMQTYQLLQEQAADLQRQLLQLQCVVSQLQQERDQTRQQHQQEIQALQQVVDAQTAALAAAAGLQQQLTDVQTKNDGLKKQSAELDGRLKATCADLAQTKAKLMSVSSTMTHLEREKVQLAEQCRCALQSNQLLQEQAADLQCQLLQLQCVVSQLQQERDQTHQQHQQEIQALQQVVDAQTAGLAAAAGLQQELNDLESQYAGLKKQSFELDGQLKTAHDDVAETKVMLWSASNTITEMSQEKGQLQVQGHCALLSNQLLQKQVTDLRCQLLQMQYMVSNLQRQQAQQHLPVATEQAVGTENRQQKPNADDASSSSRHLDTKRSITSKKPASRGSRGVQAVSLIGSAAAVVLGIVLSRRHKAST